MFSRTAFEKMYFALTTLENDILYNYFETRPDKTKYRAGEIMSIAKFC